MEHKNNLRDAEEAVSPVIGVILMVAITVVLAAVVFVLVSDLGDTGDAAPAMALTRDEGRSELRLVSTDPGLDWDMFNMRASAGLDVKLNGGEALGVGATSTENQPHRLSSGDVSGGDTFKFCGDGTAADGVRISIIHRASNTEVYSTTFVNIDACDTS